MPDTAPKPSSLPADDLGRTLLIADADRNESPHIGLVGDTYTVTLSGKDTSGRFCVIDMHVPPGGGPPPHRHDFEEPLLFWREKLKPRSGARRRYSTQERHSTFQRTHPTASTTPPRRQPGFCAPVLLPDRMIFSKY